VFIHYSKGDLGNNLLLVDTKVDVKYRNGGVIMEKVPRGKFTKEFKEEAVKMVTEGNLSIPEVGRRISIPKSTLDRWVRQSREGKLSDNNNKKIPVTDDQMELARLKREVAELKMERDILKKATAYFARESLPGTRS
jgi:transposase